MWFSTSISYALSKNHFVFEKHPLEPKHYIVLNNIVRGLEGMVHPSVMQGVMGIHTRRVDLHLPTTSGGMSLKQPQLNCVHLFAETVAISLTESIMTVRGFVTHGALRS